MKKLQVVIKNELLRYFVSPLAYVYLIAFLLLNGSFATISHDKPSNLLSLLFSGLA